MKNQNFYKSLFDFKVPDRQTKETSPANLQVQNTVNFKNQTIMCNCSLCFVLIAARTDTTMSFLVCT